MIYVKYGENRLYGFSWRCRLNMLTDDDDGRTTDAWLYYKLTHEPSCSGELTMLKIIAVQITRLLLNVGHDTGCTCGVFLFLKRLQCNAV